MTFPPFLFFITRIGTHPCIYMLLALGGEVAGLKLQIKMGQPLGGDCPNSLQHCYQELKYLNRFVLPNATTF
jgi:hypothetical protein